MRAFGNHTRFVSALQLIFVASVFGDKVSLPAARDGFVRQVAPTLNCGGAGNLCVAGADSMNGNEEPRGRFDSLIEFDSTSAIASLNATYGSNGWTVTGLQLVVVELGVPQNPIFPRGVGVARCAWLPNAAFTEGTGTPNAPIVGTGNDLTWDHLQTLLAGTPEQMLADFSSAGANGLRTCDIPISSGFAQAIRAGGVSVLHFSPLTPAMGFTFTSRNFFDALQRPMLQLTIEPIVAGDLNCDNQLNAQDAQALVLALVDPAAYAVTYAGCNINRADLDANGTADGRDISGFVDLLLGP